MKRMKVLFGQRRMQVLLTLAVLLLAASVVIGSGANFTSTSANPGNMFTAGNLTMTDSSATAVCTLDKLKPGDLNVAAGSVTISNVGDLPGTFSLTAGNLLDTAGANGGLLSTKLKIRILQDGTQIYNDDMTKLVTDSPISLGAPWAPLTTSHVFAFQVSWPDGSTPGSNTTGDNAFKGSKVAVDFTWKAVQ